MMAISNELSELVRIVEEKLAAAKVLVAHLESTLTTAKAAHVAVNGEQPPA